MNTTSRLLLTCFVLAGATPVSAQVSDSVALLDAQRFIGLLKAGEWAGAEAMVSPTVRPQLGAAQLSAIWAQVRAGLGDLNATSLLSVLPADSLRAVVLRADFASQPMALRVVFTPSREIVGFWIGELPPSESESGSPSASPPPPSPAPPYADESTFREEAVVVGAAPWQLPATLTLPRAAGRHPVVVLVHGSGPQDRDETVGGTKVFRDLAWGLASRGIAVLRYEKRTKEHGARLTSSITVDDEVVVDALAALELVRARPEIDPSKIYVAGHSLGGQLAPEIARRDGRLAGAVLLAAPARPLDQILVAQLEYLKALPSNAAPEAQAQIDALLVQARRLVSNEAADSETILGAPVSYFRELVRRSAVAEALRLDVPILVLQGGRDYQITMEDFALWQQALGSRPTATLRSFPSLNHVFVAGSGPSVPAEYGVPGFVSEEVIGVLAEWIR